MSDADKALDQELVEKIEQEVLDAIERVKADYDQHPEELNEALKNVTYAVGDDCGLSVSEAEDGADDEDDPSGHA